MHNIDFLVYETKLGFDISLNMSTTEPDKTLYFQWN